MQKWGIEVEFDEFAEEKSGEELICKFISLNFILNFFRF
jgi:hypothetical protein